MSESKISQLIKKRGSQKCKLTGFCNYISLIKNITTIDSPQILNEIKSRLQKMEILYSEFDALQGQIEELSEDPEERYQENCSRTDELLAGRDLRNAVRSANRVTRRVIRTEVSDVTLAGAVVAAARLLVLDRWCWCCGCCCWTAGAGLLVLG
ncbi:hypothetical protein ACJJTC_005368 [Scirpophaga incertulas]